MLWWISSHAGISGNEEVDKAARSSVNKLPEKNIKIQSTGFKIKIDKYIQK